MSLFTYRGAVEVSSGSSTSARSADESSVDHLAQHALLTGCGATSSTAHQTAALLCVPATRGRRIRPLQQFYVEQMNNEDTSTDDFSDDDDEVLDEYCKRVHHQLQQLGHSTSSAQPGADDVAPRRPRRKPDLIARARLYGLNACTQAKVRQKYEKQRQMEKEKLARRRVPRLPIATKAGERLHQQARGLHTRNAEMAADEAKKREEENKRACTFKPSISSFAKELREPFYTVDYDEERAERERRRKSAEEAALRSCTFHPTISPGSEALMRDIRGEMKKMEDASNHDPYNTGDRLYREGGKNMLRQQLRRTMEEENAEQHRIGSNIRLSEREVHVLHRRLNEWDAQRHKNRRALQQRALYRAPVVSASMLEQVVERLSHPVQEEEEDVVNEMAHKKQQQRVGRTSRPAERTTSATPAATSPSPQRSGSMANAATWVVSPLTSKSRSPSRIVHKNTPTTTTTTKEEVSGVGAAAHEVYDTRPPCAASSSNSTTTNTNTIREHVGGMRGDDRAFRLLRFGALFYKYAPTQGDGSAVSRAEVEAKVRLLYPEDVAVVLALDEVDGRGDEHQPITKASFVAALAAYEARHGPQPYGRTAKDALLFSSKAPPQTYPRPSPSPSPSRETTTSCGGVSTARSSTLARIHSGTALAPNTTSPRGPATPPHPRASSPVVRADDAKHAPTQPSSVAMSSSPSNLSAGQPPQPRRRRPIVRGEMHECSFAPHLGRRTAELSELDRAKRLASTQRLKLRDREVALLQSLTRRARATTTTSSPPAVKPAKRAAAIITSTPPSAQKDGRRPSSQPNGLSPSSAEISSVSSCTTSSHTARSPSLTLRPSPEAAGGRPPTSMATPPSLHVDPCSSARGAASGKPPMAPPSSSSYALMKGDARVFVREGHDTREDEDVEQLFRSMYAAASRSW